MIMGILKFVHVLLILGALGTGITFAVRMVAGRRFGRRTVQFLQFSLSASAVGILLSLGHASPIQWFAVLGVYLSAVAVWAWHKFQLADRWAPLFVLSAVGVLCLDLVAGFSDLSRLLAWLNVLEPAQRNLTVLAGPMAGVLFAALGACAMWRFHHKTHGPVVPKMAG